MPQKNVIGPRWLIFTCSLLAGALAVSLPVQAVTPAFLDQAVLEQVRQQLHHHQASEPTREAWRQLKRQADKALPLPLMSVTEKGMLPPGGTKHDYLSLSAYWWPDPQHPDGRWIRRDGEINPASKNNQSDGVRLAAFTARVQTLTLAWYFSGEQKYADRAMALLRYWFINPGSKMNPNLNFAQGVEGVAAGRSTGILDGRYFATRVVDSVILLRDAPGWQQSDEQGIHAWMQDYLSWLKNSKAGKREARAENNHGSWYNVQVAGIAWYLQDLPLIRQQVRAARNRMQQQIAADGSQPLELKRTRSFHYSYFNLQALVSLAVLAEKAGADDLWRPAAVEKVAILTALDFMAPYADASKAWPYPSRDRVSDRLIPLLAQADISLDRDHYQSWIKQATFTTDNKAEQGASEGARRDTWLLSLPRFARQ